MGMQTSGILVAWKSHVRSTVQSLSGMGVRALQEPSGIFMRILSMP